MGQDPTTNLQCNEPKLQSKLTKEELESTITELTTPLLYTAVTEACGEEGVSHLPDCREKNCLTKELDEMIDEAKEEDDDVTYVCAAAMLSKQEMLDQVPRASVMQHSPTSRSYHGDSNKH